MTARLFVAIWPDDAARDALTDLVDRAQQAAPDVRWQAPARWHITLAFLGQADPGKSVARIDALVRADALMAAEPIRLHRSGAFGPVIWVGVDHGLWLADLAGGFQRTLRVADRRFRAHLTVGRIRGSGGPERAREVGALLSSHVGPTWTPSQVTLVESTTGPAPSYRIRDRWPLGPLQPSAPPSAATHDTPGRAMTGSATPETLEEP